MKYLQAVVNGLMEVLESIGLGFCVIMAYPLLFFRRFDRVFRFLSFAKVLIPRKLFSLSVRAMVDIKLENYQQAAAQLNQIVGLLERELEEVEAPGVRMVLTSFYNQLVKVHLLGGQMDDATLVVIRASSRLGIEHLPHLPEFDVKTAHVVKAGIVAGRRSISNLATSVADFATLSL